MPNWCHNRVDVYGEVDEIKRFQEFVNGNQEPFSFESISPMPEELRWVQSPVSIKTQEEIDKFNKSKVGTKLQKELSQLFDNDFSNYGFGG